MSKRRFAGMHLGICSTFFSQARLPNVFRLFLVVLSKPLEWCSSCRQREKKTVVQEWLQTFWNRLSSGWFYRTSANSERKQGEKKELGCMYRGEPKRERENVLKKCALKPNKTLGEQRDEFSDGPWCIVYKSAWETVACWDLLKENSHDVIPRVIGLKHFYTGGQTKEWEMSDVPEVMSSVS